MRLANKVCIVTGGGSGIGRATALLFAAEGARLAVADRRAAAAEAVASECAGKGAEAISVTADVARAPDVKRMIEKTVERFGRLDVLVNNAGYGIPGSVVETDEEAWDALMAVNVRGVFLGLRGAFRGYREQGTTGNVVLTASIASLRGSADLIAYQTSKHAVLGLLRGAAMYGGPLGIRVNAVAPGIVPTDLFSAAGREDMVRRAATTPLRRAGTPAEIAAVVLFLLSEESAFLTGEVVSVDGGAAIMSTVRSSGGAGAWDFAALDHRTYRREE